MSVNHEYSIRENRMHESLDSDRDRFGATGRALAQWAVAAFRRAIRRARLRRDLEWLDARLLRDIGIAREDLEAEARKPFWRG